ncbi:MAG TPA: hypothetical protein PLU25_10765, partial [Acidobacteriota bacterium]|nr:hypothetical protein [Acidobacteriota bacterium]
GVLGWAFQLNTRFELGLPIDVDEDFEVIYPALKKWDWKASAQASLERIPEIAQRWQKTGPEQIRRRLTLYEDEYRLNLIHRLNLQSSFVQVLEQQSKG